MSIAKWKENEKEQRRENIIDAARKLFFDTDYESVTMDEIAKEIGLGKGTLYLYFNSKESLFYAVALRGMRILNSMHAGCLNLNTESIDKLHAMTKGYYEFTQEYPEYFLLLCYIAAHPSSRKDDGYVREFMELAITNVQIISKVLEEGVTDGKIRKDLDPDEMAVFLSIIAISIMNMDPVWKRTLKAIGTGENQIWNHYERFITPAVETDHGLDLNCERDYNSQTRLSELKKAQKTMNDDNKK